MEQDLSFKFRGSPKELPKKYHRLIQAQKGVIAHVKQCYKIRYEEVKSQSKKQKDYKLLLERSVDCDLPPMPPLESFKELESDYDNLFNKDEVDELYKNEPKADAWRALSWDLDSIHRSYETISTNIDVLGSDDHTYDNCDKTKKELAKDDEICLEIHPIVSLSASDDIDAIHANDIIPMT